MAKFKIGDKIKAKSDSDKETEAKLLAEPSEPVKEEPNFKVGELLDVEWKDKVEHIYDK